MARIAVIGAGMGAMAAAARLAVAGHRVAVYERTGTYGGAVRRFERDGFSFDTGPGLLPLPAVWRDLFVKTGKEPLESCVELVQVDPSSRHLFADGTEVSLPNASRAGVVDALDEALGPPAGQRWGDLLVRAREAWDRTRRPLLEEPLWPDWRVLAEREPYPAVPHKRLLRTRRAGTLAEVAAWELRDARLTALLEGCALAYGLDPRSVPANAAVLPYMEHAFGMWYVRGGLRELARAVYERCRERRVEFRFDTEVTGIVEKDGRVAGVSWPVVRWPRPSTWSPVWRPACWTASPGTRWCAVRTGFRRSAGRRAGSRCCWRCGAAVPGARRTGRWCTPGTARASWTTCSVPRPARPRIRP